MSLYEPFPTLTSHSLSHSFISLPTYVYLPMSTYLCLITYVYLPLSVTSPSLCHSSHLPLSVTPLISLPLAPLTPYPLYLPMSRNLPTYPHIFLYNCHRPRSQYQSCLFTLLESHFIAHGPQVCFA